MSLETPVFVNKISNVKTEFTPLAFKKVDGRNPFANENFEFVLHKEDGSVISKAQNNKQYISFPPIAYTAKDAGKTFHYYIDEFTKEGYVCDTERVEVTVTVAFSEFAGLVAEGSYKKGNLQCTCKVCNGFKSHILPEEFAERITNIFCFQMKKRFGKSLKWKIVHRFLRGMLEVR